MSDKREILAGKIVISSRNFVPQPSSEGEPSNRTNASRQSTYKTYDELTPEEQQAQDLEDSIALEQAQGEIIVDTDSEYAESGYGTDSTQSATTSISSHVRDYQFEHGRRYHNYRQGAYNFPNEDSEQDREDMKHAMFLALVHFLHLSPISNPHNVLDLGTGTGIWAIESKIIPTKSELLANL